MTIAGDISQGAVCAARRRCEHGWVKNPAPVQRFRHNSAITVAAVIGMICVISVGSWQPYLLVLLLIPLSFAIWGWRSGTDVDTDGLTVRAALGRRRLTWNEVTALRPQGRTVVAELTSGARVVLAAVAPADLPTLVAATGQSLGRTPTRTA